ncbi:hypothetical protein HPP92_021796 [Vanilla planifolia]|uniref:Uncharacterized protein n=1 Tax=Vanilla planifolia TaxID=51239 RepID=A0A835PTK4_VANPL|nr:hypothetical protein HPP92_021796 [Vanilla planifolia]
MAEDDVRLEVEAVLSVYGNDCNLIQDFPPHLTVRIKPRTAEDSSQEFVEVTLGIKSKFKATFEDKMTIKDSSQPGNEALFIDKLTTPNIDQLEVFIKLPKTIDLLIHFYWMRLQSSKDETSCFGSSSHKSTLRKDVEESLIVIANAEYVSLLWSKLFFGFDTLVAIVIDNGFMLFLKDPKNFVTHHDANDVCFCEPPKDQRPCKVPDEAPYIYVTDMKGLMTVGKPI